MIVLDSITFYPVPLKKYNDMNNRSERGDSIVEKPKEEFDLLDWAAGLASK